jgi:hypothetical protein
MRLSEMENDRPLASLTPHVNPDQIMTHPPSRRLVNPLTSLRGKRGVMVLKRLAKTICHGSIHQSTHRHHHEQRHEAFRLFQRPRGR